jgi:hypothetical protein
MNAAERLTPNAGEWDWIYYKSWLSLAAGVSDDVLHIFAGLGLVVLFAAVLRRAPWHWLPWLGALVLELANETYDLTQTSYVTGEGNFPAAWHDVWMTMLWPTVIVLAFPRLAARADATAERRRAAAGAAASEPQPEASATPSAPTQSPPTSSPPT